MVMGWEWSISRGDWKNALALEKGLMGASCSETPSVPGGLRRGVG